MIQHSADFWKFDLRSRFEVRNGFWAQSNAKSSWFDIRPIFENLICDGRFHSFENFLFLTFWLFENLVWKKLATLHAEGRKSECSMEIQIIQVLTLKNSKDAKMRAWSNRPLNQAPGQSSEAQCQGWSWNPTADAIVKMRLQAHAKGRMWAVAICVTISFKVLLTHPVTAIDCHRKVLAVLY